MRVESDVSTSSRQTNGTTEEGARNVVYVLQERMDVERGARVLMSEPMRDMSKKDTPQWRGYSNAIGLAKQLGGYLPVRYYMRADRQGFGRYSAEVTANGCGSSVPMYMRMKREIRAHLAAPIYWDVDMVNSSPAMLKQTLDMYNVTAPMLSRYVLHREESITEVMEQCEVDREAAKNLFIRIVFFGCVDAWVQSDGPQLSGVPTWVRDLSNELQKAATELLAHPDFGTLNAYVASRKVTGNRLGKTVSMFLQTKERECLDALVEAVQNDGRTVGALIYDGMHIEKDMNDGPDGIEVETLQRWRAHVRRKTGYDIGLAVKRFDPNPLWTAADTGCRGTESEGYWDDRWMSGETPMLSYEDMKSRWERRAFKAVVMGRYVREERTERAVYTRHQLIDAYEHLRYTIVTVKEDGDIKVRRHPFIFGGSSTNAPVSWLADPQIRAYKYMGMYPPPLDGPENLYNTWDGFNAARYKPTKEVDVESEAVRAYIGHLTKLLHGDQPSVDYVMKWMAQIFQEPGIKRGIALIIKGGEGAGKNRLVDLLNLMVGEDKFFETAKPSTTLYGQFTQSRRDKFIIAINEASGGDNFSANDVIKDMITAPTFVCEGKGKDAVTARCYARFVFTTNNDNVLRVNPDSRRFVVFDVSNELVGDTAYFNRLSAHIEDPHGRHEFHRYLMAVDLSNTNWTSDRPITEYYRRMVELNLDREYQFLKSQVLLPAHYVRKASVTMLARTMFNEFKEWLIETSTSGTPRYETTETKFGNKMGALVSGSGMMPGVTKKKTEKGWRYNFEVNVVCQAMSERKWISAEDMEARRAPVTLQEFYE